METAIAEQFAKFLITILPDSDYINLTRTNSEIIVCVDDDTRVFSIKEAQGIKKILEKEERL